MSKESYMRGFVKAAQAMGVDPQALVKYAQATDKVQKVEAPKYKTDGWAPKSVSDLGTDVIPGYDITDDTAKPLTEPIPLVRHAYEYALQPEMTNAVARLAKLKAAVGQADPRLVPFIQAYNEALGDTGGAVASVFNTGKYDDLVHEKLPGSVPTSFHQRLFALTNGSPLKASAPATTSALPVQVSAPAKK